MTSLNVLVVEYQKEGSYALTPDYELPTPDSQKTPHRHAGYSKLTCFMNIESDAIHNDCLRSPDNLDGRSLCEIFRMVKLQELNA